MKCKNHDWVYDITDSWYVMINRKCVECKEEEETKFGLSDDDFEVIAND